MIKIIGVSEERTVELIKKFADKENLVSVLSHYYKDSIMDQDKQVEIVLTSELHNFSITVLIKIVDCSAYIANKTWSPEFIEPAGMALISLTKATTTLRRLVYVIEKGNK